jgi:hypothetical protein
MGDIFGEGIGTGLLYFFVLPLFFAPLNSA